MRHKKLAMMMATVLGGGGAFDYYVDSVNGDDANSGRSSSAALKTIGALPTITANMRIGLACGSHWREQIAISVNNVTIGSYGSGSRPILDGSDVVAVWSKTGGLTNVYEVSVTPAWGGAGTEWLNTFEDSVFLKRVASTALCDSTPGSYYPSAATGTITLYIHTTDSNDPNTNGSVYEYTQRSACILAQNYSGLTITGIHAQKQLGDAGSIVVGRNATITDCVCSFGGKHNIEYAGGSVLTDVTCNEAYYGTTAGVMYIAFENNGAGAPITHTRCTASNTVYDSYISGFGCHVGSGQPDFGVVTYTGCTGSNLGYMFSNTSDISGFVCVDCVANLCTFGIAVSTASIVYTINNFTYTSNVANSIGISAAVETTVNITGGTYTINAPGSTTTGIISTGTANTTLTITGATFRLNNTTGNRRCVDSRSTGASLTLTQNDYGGTATSIFVLYQTVLVPYTSNNNRFASNDLQNYINAVSYATVAAYQAATGQDADSTIG